MTNYPKLSSLKQQVFIISPILVSRNQEQLGKVPLAQSFSWGCSQVVSSESLIRDCRSYPLLSLLKWLLRSFSPLPCGPLHGTASESELTSLRWGIWKKGRPNRRTYHDKIHSPNFGSDSPSFTLYFIYWTLISKSSPYPSGVKYTKTWIPGDKDHWEPSSGLLTYIIHLLDYLNSGSLN